MITSIGQLRDPDSDYFLKVWKTKVDPARRLLMDHRHLNFEIAYVQQGLGSYITVAGELPIEPGDIFVFPSNEPHWISRIQHGGLEIVNLHFSQSFFQKACSISQSYPNLFWGHSGSFSPRIPAECSMPIRQLLNTIYEELQEKKIEHEIYIHSAVNMIFATLMRSFQYYLPTEGMHRTMERILPGIRFIDNEYCSNISLEQIAQKSGLSPNYYTKLFKDCFQMRLWDYVLSKRINKAKQMLRSETENTILQIALACGFNNTANFNKAFLRFTGLTPKEYRDGSPIH